MNFEFDLQKSDSNRRKHGIGFSAARLLWADPDRIQIPAKEVDEPRFMVIGKIEEKHWSAIITYRDEKIRIISVRRSRDEEIEIYEG
ncbi:MAG: BrnT family toxin [Desulfosarcina sp.]|nr:BrnT family toxin [Desulfosarcina sp.]MBC2764542.1 BrnT family toxin [Desulfosarcina sp.]